MAWDTDKQFKEYTVAEVCERGDGWEVGWRDGFWLYVTNELCKQPPARGEVARCYGKGFGYEVRGVVINGRVYRYKTEAEQEQERTDYLARRQREQAEALERERPERDQKIAALPEPLRQRIARFQRALGGWRAQHEPYEIFCCEEAAVIAAKLKTRAAIADFHRLPWEQQKEALPGLRYDQHSGNTFGFSCRLAALLCDRSDLVAQEHGALCPLVGCVDYGCFAAYEGKVERESGDEKP
jgi:hypothetical protein